MQRHQEQRRADTSALVDAARGQMPELPPYVPEFDLAFMSQMLGGGAVRSEAEDTATGDDETIVQEAAVDIALQLLTMTIVRSVFFWSCGTSLRSPPHAPPSGHGWSDGARRAPSDHPTPVTESERAQPQEVPNRANSARLAAPLA